MNRGNTKGKANGGDDDTEETTEQTTNDTTGEAEDNEDDISISETENDDDEERKIATLTANYKEYKNIELNIPELICKLEKEDSSDDESSGEDNQGKGETKDQKQPQLPIETRLKQLKEAMERISSAQRERKYNEDNNRMPRLQERDREDSDSESDNEEDDQHYEDLLMENEDEQDIHVGQTPLEKRHTITENEADHIQLKTPIALEKRNNPTMNEDNNNTQGERDSTSDDGDLFFESSDDDDEEEEATTDTNNNENTENQPNMKETGDTGKATPTKLLKVTNENLPFGHICDDIAVDNDTPYVRVYCQNVCGIFDREGLGLESAFKEIKQAGADIFMFNETHGDESKATARRAIRMAKQRMWSDTNENCKIVHSSSNAPVLTFTKPGGNMMGITGPLVGRIRETIADPYGRWCGYTLLGKDDKEIMILTAYNVSQYKNAKVGTDTLFNQQVALYKLKDIREPDPKKLFIKDLIKLVTQARGEDKDIILAGDFNELIGDDPNGMAAVLQAGNLTDAHSHQHGEVEISTYTRGSKRLDYIFTTPRLVDHILRSGYEPFHARIASDHRGYFVDFDLAGFLDRQLPSIFSASSRAIRGTHPSNITKYIKHLHRVFEERDVYRRVKLQKNWYEKKKLERLDREITAIMLEAEEQCRIHHRQPWTQEVNEVMTTANILRINLSSLRNNLDCTKQITQKQELLKQQIVLPENIIEASTALTMAQKKCRTLIKEQRTKKTSIEEEQELAYVAMNPEMNATRAAQIFKRAKDTKQMMSELPSKRNCPGGISAVLVPLPKEGIEIEYLAINDGPTLETIILQKNIRHFRQAETTPLATPEIINKIGFAADTTISEQLLEGNKDPSDITDDEWSRYLLASMKRHSKEIKVTITKEKMMEKYERWKERTSTSPSGRHLGHFHALFKPLKAKNKKEREKLDGIRDDIIELHATMQSMYTKDGSTY